MMGIIVSFRKSDGEITGAYSAGSTSAKLPPGEEEVELKISAPPDPRTQRICDGRLVWKTAAEKRLARLPTRAQVEGAIRAELSLTDFTQLPDTRFTPQERALWATYREALRDLSKIADPESMIRAWPVNPGGSDSEIVAALKTRI
jgi:hypothetical protein